MHLLWWFLFFTTFCCFITAQSQAQSITTSVPAIVDPNIPITVSWPASQIPQRGDVLIIYLIPTSPNFPPLPIPDSFERKHIVGFYKIYELPPTTLSVDVTVILPRDYAYYFEYRRIKVPVGNELIFYSALVPDAHINVCSQFHLSFTHNQTNLQLAYTTSQPSTSTQWVHLSPNKATIDLDVWTSPISNTTADSFYPTIDSGTYTIDDMFSPPASEPEFFINPGRFRESLLSTSPIAAKYYYRVRNAQGKSLSKTFHLFTPQQRFPQSNGLGSVQQFDTDVFCFGDSGVGFDFYTVFDAQTHAKQTYASIARVIAARQQDGDMTPTHILHNGDLSYSRGYMVLLEHFFQQIEPLSSQFPWSISIGNHEICYESPSAYCQGADSGGEQGIPTFMRWKMPPDFHYYPYDAQSIITDQQTEIYRKENMRNIAYSYNVGYIHFVVFTIELDWTANSAQYKFLVKDLENVDRKLYPFVILAAHRTPYCTDEECTISTTPPEKNKKDLRIRQLIQPLMVQYGVSIGLWGHEHTYERFKLMVEDYIPVTQFTDKHGQTVPTYSVHQGIEHIYSVAPLNILSGIAGNHFNRPWVAYSPTIHLNMSSYHHQTPEHVSFRQMGTFGYSHFRANATHLTGKFYSSSSDTVHDHFILIKPQ